MTSLTDFLLARIAEDEAVARAAAGWRRDGQTRASGRWTRTGIASLEDDEGWSVIYSDADQLTADAADHIARHDPARVLAECAAKRAILAEAVNYSPELEYGDNGEWAFEAVLRHLAQPFVDHPDYDQSWSVS